MVLFRRRRIKWLDSLGYDRDRIQKRKFSGLTIFFTGLLCMTLHSKWNSINTRIEEDISHDLSKTDLHGAVRRLLATDNETHHLPLWEECSAEQSTSFSGLFVFTHSLGILIIFVALAIVCDDFFVPSLEAISEKLRLSEDVAGATFMAAGSSAPELFTSIAGVAFETDVGVGTIVGSAVFNILIIIALTAALAGQVLNLDWRPLIRDSFCYAVSIILFIQFAWDGEFTLYEAIILLVLYILYILLMVINPKLMDWMAKWRCICKKKAEVLPIDAELGKRGSQDGGQTNVDMVNGGSQILKEPPKPVVSFAGGHARRLSLISQGSMSNMPDKHYFQHQRGSIMGALYDTPPATPTHSDRDSGFKSTDNSCASPNWDTSHTDLPNCTDETYYTEDTLRPPHVAPQGRVNNGYLPSDVGEEHLQTSAKSMKVKFYADVHAVKQIDLGSPERQHGSMFIRERSGSDHTPLSSRYSEPDMNATHKRHSLPPIQTNHRPTQDSMPLQSSVLPPIRPGDREQKYSFAEGTRKSISQDSDSCGSGPQENNNVANSMLLLNSQTLLKTPALSNSDLPHSDPSLNSDLQTFPAKRPHMTIEEQIEERSSEESEHDSKSDREEEEVRKEEEKEDTQDKVSETNTVDDEAGMVNLCPCFPCCPKVNVAPPERGGPGCWEAVKIVLRWFIYIVSFPFVILFTWTIPDCSQEHNKKWFLVSFFMAVLWIAILSFVMVLLVGRTGCILHIDSFVMGLVIIAVGTSVPDALSSILVAREGYGDMAVSNAIGSNVFDINLGLGLPFLITIAIKGGASLRLLNEEQQDAFDAGLMLLTPHAKFGFILLFILAMCLSIFLMARFRLTKGIGISFVIIYVLFMVYAFVQELVCRGKC